MFQSGRRLRLSYPVSTQVDRITHSARRERDVVISGARDLFAEPLTVDEFLGRPYVARSRWLLSGLDTTIGDCRAFYAGSSDEFRSPQTMRIIFVDRTTGEIVDSIRRVFRPTVDDCDLIVRLINHWRTLDAGDVEMKIQCLDLDIVG